LTASVLRDIEGGVPVEADHILGDLLRRARRCGRQPLAGAHRQCQRESLRGTAAAQSGGGRKRGTIITPRGRHMSDREPSTKPQKLWQLPALYRAFAGRAANLAIGEASPAQGGSSRRGSLPD
jgi:hypothetical protein